MIYIIIIIILVIYKIIEEKISNIKINIEDNESKNEIYECGYISIKRIKRFTIIESYVYMMFILFEVEIILLYLTGIIGYKGIDILYIVMIGIKYELLIL